MKPEIILYTWYNNDNTNFNALNETDIRQVAFENHIKDDYI